MVVIVLVLVDSLHQWDWIANLASNLVKYKSGALVQNERCLAIVRAVSRDLASDHEYSVQSDVLLVKIELGDNLTVYESFGGTYTIRDLELHTLAMDLKTHPFLQIALRRCSSIFGCIYIAIELFIGRIIPAILASMAQTCNLDCEKLLLDFANFEKAQLVNRPRSQFLWDHFKPTCD